MKKIDIEEFRVPEGSAVRLDEWPTKRRAYYESKRDYEKILSGQVEELSDRQAMLYAHNRYALLVIFQAMDAAGKDGAIKHVMSGVNPQGCQVFSFKHPSPEELDHDFLWRTTRNLPERGRIGIFNRSYYEEVLIVRVHPEILRGQSLPREHLNHDGIWESRYRSIRDLEWHLHENGTRTIKFFLHVSQEEQWRRFLARIEDPKKNWKFSRSDVEESRLWPQYMRAYEDCLAATSTEFAPWYVVPADDKPNARLIIAHVISETLDRLRMDWPKLTKTQEKDLREMRKVLSKKPPSRTGKRRK